MKNTIAKCCLLIILLLLFTACYNTLQLTTWDALEQARIESVIARVSPAEVSSLLDDLNGIRYGFDTSGALDIYQAAFTDRFAAYGMTVVLELPAYNAHMEAEPVMNNIIATLPGSRPELAPVLITAHWDTVAGSPGIDDNATGCAAVMEAARIFKDFIFPRSILFVLFAYEEQCMLGSADYVKHMTREPCLVLNYEMIGYTAEKQDMPTGADILLDFPPAADFVAVFGNTFAKTPVFDFSKIVDTFVPDLKYYLFVTDDNFSNNPLLNDVLRSDHVSFWEQGIPALFFSDTANLRNPNYHTMADTLDKLDMDFLENCIKASLALAMLHADKV